jgi:hypothetical protein
LPRRNTFQARPILARRTGRFCATREDLITAAVEFVAMLEPFISLSVIRRAGMEATYG